LEILKGTSLNPYGLHSADLRELTIHLCAQMLEVGKIVKTIAEGRKLAIKKLQDGTAWELFKKMIAAQGGNIDTFEEPWRYMKAEKVVELTAKKRGFVTEMSSEALGRLLTVLGGGRNQVGEKLDHSVGFFFHKKLGSSVKPDDTLVTIFGSSKTDFGVLESDLRQAIKISSAKKTAPKLIIEASVK